MRFFHSMRAVLALAVIAMSVSLVAVDHAEARRGGSFGSRGARTFNSPAATQTAPRTTNSIDRSMTPRQQAQPGAAAGGAAAAGQRRGMFGGMAGGLLGGLMLGGLIGMMMGNGLGGMAGLLGLLVQVGLAVLVVSLILRWFRSRQQQQQPAYAGSSGSPRERDEAPDASRTAYQGAGAGKALGGLGGLGGGSRSEPVASVEPAGGDQVGLTAEDYDAFEQLLVEVQAAFSREDYAALRQRCTPEMVSFLSEELSQNAVDGHKNDVTDVRLLQGDLSEAWNEDGKDYATVAMRYASVDVMRDRKSGEVVSGDTTSSETIEIWTFVRPAGARWQLSAIQET